MPLSEEVALRLAGGDSHQQGFFKATAHFEKAMQDACYLKDEGAKSGGQID